jgi:DNA replication protein DnaC
LHDLRRMMHRQGLQDGRYARMNLKNWEFRNASCEAIAKKLKRYLDNVQLDARNWLFLFGGYGLGKTHLAVSALKHLSLDRQWEVQIVRWSEYCSLIQQSWHAPDAESEYALWRRAAKVTLLVLDDIDKRTSSDWALGKLYELIDHRYIRQLPTILTANRCIEALADYWAKSESMNGLAHAIISRIIGQLSSAIEFSGSDYRLGAAEDRQGAES